MTSLIKNVSLQPGFKRSPVLNFYIYDIKIELQTNYGGPSGHSISNIRRLIEQKSICSTNKNPSLKNFSASKIHHTSYVNYLGFDEYHTSITFDDALDPNEFATLDILLKLLINMNV
jgi:hypothetical protein